MQELLLSCLSPIPVSKFFYLWNKKPWGFSSGKPVVNVEVKSSPDLGTAVLDVHWLAHMAGGFWCISGMRNAIPEHAVKLKLLGELEEEGMDITWWEEMWGLVQLWTKAPLIVSTLGFSLCCYLAVHLWHSGWPFGSLSFAVPVGDTSPCLECSSLWFGVETVAKWALVSAGPAGALGAVSEVMLHPAIRLLPLVPPRNALSFAGFFFCMISSS